MNLVGLKRRGSKREDMKKLVDVFSRLFEKKGNQSFQERLEAIAKDELYQITEVQKVIKFMKQESARSYVAPKT